MNVAIRAIEAVDEYRACEEIQRRAWQMPDDLEVVPAHQLIAVTNAGGLLLGAFDGDRLVGFVYGFPGLTAQGKIRHYSHMMGVLPEYRRRSIGLQLKMAQRQAVLAQGIDLITWTYDPLESRNAHLNVARLGAVCRTYYRDLYGPLADDLNEGLPTDRFEVEWWIAGQRVIRRLEGEPQPALPEPAVWANVTQRTDVGWRAPGRLVLAEAQAEVVQFEIPADYQAIKAADPPLAMAWRLAARQIFETYFARGYAAVACYTWQAGDERRCAYALAPTAGL
ncbi:MAG: GNAT family N-acetyltransferase [Anaerolineae bacterium]